MTPLLIRDAALMAGPTHRFVRRGWLLLRDGVIVRPVANYGLPGFLRVTVGLPAENERFLAALGRALSGPRANA